MKATMVEVPAMKHFPFYHIHSATMDGCDLTDEADAVASATWLCFGCCTPKPGVTTIDVSLTAPPGKEPLNAVMGCGVPIASKSFLDRFGAELVERDLYVGKVFGPYDEELTDWSTFRGKHKIIVRGKEHAGARKCDECGRDVYFAMDNTYLYPAPPAGISLFESHLSGLVVAEDVFLRAGIHKQRGIWINKLRIARVPDDSLGELTIE
jgi:hypothetical protein